MRIKIREVTDRGEILKAFSHLYTDRSKVLLWQTSKNDSSKKTLIYCELISIDNSTIYLTPYSTTIKEILNQTIKTRNKIFIRGTYNGVLFKSDNFIIRGDKLEIPVPKKILLSENRNSKRFIIGDKNYAYIKILNKSLEKTNQRKSYKIHDFGLKGFSIQMTKYESHYFEINGSYHIDSIAGIALPKNYQAKLVYQRVHTYIKNAKSQVTFKVGFMLNKDLPLKVYNLLLDMHNSLKDVA